MITPEMLKPLIDKWEGILEIALDKSYEPERNVIRDTRTGTKFSMELLSKLYTPQNVLYELDKQFGSEHLFDSDWLPSAVLQDFNRMDSGIIYFSVNNWMYGQDYPPTENFRKWLGNDLSQTFQNEEWVKENKLCVRCGFVDMSQNYLVSAPREWVEKNCPELLTNFEYTYTSIINGKEVEHKGKYSKFVYSPDYGLDCDEFKCEDRFGWPFLEYKEENIGVHWYEEEPEPEEDEEEGETSSED